MKIIVIIMRKMNLTKDCMFLSFVGILMTCSCSSSSDAENSMTDEVEDGEVTEVLAFPTAEGYGKNTVGGRGGVVYEVTNLKDDGNGSLRAAVEASGPRTVVFRVSGIIELKSPLRIRNPYITIAGQTAPGDGICLKNYQITIDASEVIIRYIRIRLGDNIDSAQDAIFCRYYKNIIIDHVSASWSIDECISIYRCDNVTIQWSIIAESLYKSKHEKGNHGFGGIWGSNNSTYHHNLLAHHTSRNPRFSDGSGYNDFRNNVIYNWAYNSCYGGAGFDSSMPEYNSFTVNIVANYYKPGPATRPDWTSYRIANPTTLDSNGNPCYGKWYIADNYMAGNAKVTANNWDGGVQISNGDLLQLKLNKPWNSMPINQETPAEAFESVMSNAGSILPKRDLVDERIIAEVRGGYATYEGSGYKTDGKPIPDITKKCGIIDTQEDVGGWPEYKSLPAPVDTDHDGMPDEWEKEKGLNPNDPSDRNKIAKNGYTYLEVYLNSIQ